MAVPVGTIGVWAFFTLSAFLLTGRLMDDPEAFGLAGLARYGLRRAFRILPLYAAFVVVYGYTVAVEPHFVRANLVHFAGNGHLWTINQELLFYLFLPGFAFAVTPLRRWPILAAAALLVAAALAERYVGINVLRVHAMTGWANLYWGPFLCGMAAAYLMPLAQRQGERLRAHPRIVAGVSAAFGLALFGLCWWLSVAFRTAAPGTNPANEVTIVSGLLVGLLLLWLVAAPPNWLSVGLGFAPLRAVGLAGFSFYLLHWPVFVLVGPYTDPDTIFPLCFLVTAGVSQITYRAIERPGIALGNRLASAVRFGPPFRLKPRMS